MAIKIDPENYGDYLKMRCFSRSSSFFHAEAGIVLHLIILNFEQK